MYVNPAYTLLIFLSFLFFGWSIKLVAQTNNKHKQTAEILDKAKFVYGPNEMLENGRIYIPTHSRAKENPYFSGTDWMTAKMIIKGDLLEDLRIKYNVNLEQIILKKEVENQESHIPIVLNNDFIDAFDSDGHHFINLKTMPISEDLSGFAELIYDGQMVFLVKHTKEFLNRYSQSNPYGAYSKLYSVYYIYENEKLTRVATKGAFLNYFEPIKKEVKKFIRKHKIKYKKATNSQLYQLIEYCEDKSHN